MCKGNTINIGSGELNALTYIVVDEGGVGVLSRSIVDDVFDVPCGAEEVIVVCALQSIPEAVDS